MTARRTLIRDALLYTPDGPIEGDCLIEGDRVAQLGARVSTRDHDEEIDAGGRWLWPGAIDAHVHFREPGLTTKEDWHTASEAAVAGGVTCAFDMPNTSPSTTTSEALAAKRALVASKSLINFGLFFGANPHNLDQILSVDNIPALKIFMASSTGDLLVDRDEDLACIFSQYEGRISVHAEDEPRLIARAAEFADRRDPAAHSEVRDPEAARLGVERAARLANQYARRLHVLHVSTAAEIEALRVGRAEALQTGARITGEACPHHLFLTTRAYEAWGNRVKMNPPLRNESDLTATWHALLEGDLQMVATDHAPHSAEDKSRPYPEAPSGVPGVQTMVPLLLDAALTLGRCLPEQIVEWVCHAPAEIYGIQDRGRLEQGSYADLVLIDPDLTRTIRDEEQRSRCGWTPWAGRTTTGWPVMTWVNGQLVYRRMTHEQTAWFGEAPCGVEASFAP